MRLFGPNVPFAPSKFPFFYGWVVVAASTVGVLMSIPGQTMGVSVFTDPLIDATGLSRLELSNAYLMGTIASALTLPFGGTLLDRFGARRTALGATLGLCVTLFYLSQVDRFTSGPLLQTVMLVLGFFALRFSGQGMLTMVSRTMLGKWFSRRRGLASGISGIFVSFGFAAAPLGFSAWVEQSGWRGAWQQIGIMVLVVMGATAFLFFRDNPELCGLQMDGDAPDSPTSSAVAKQFTRREALRTLAFWTVTFALAAQAMVVTGLTFHIVDIGAGASMDEKEIVAIFIPMAVLSTITGLVAGWLIDKIRIGYLVTFMMFMQAVSLFSLIQLDSALGYWGVVAGVGMAGGCFSPLSTVAFPRFFGRDNLGAISGIEMMCVVVGSAIGPSLFALSSTYTGSYQTAFQIALALPVIGGVMSLIMRNPQRAN